MMTIEFWPGDRVRWRKVEFTVTSIWSDGTVDLWDDHYQLMQPDVKASGYRETNGQIKRPPIRVAGCDYQE